MLRPFILSSNLVICVVATTSWLSATEPTPEACIDRKAVVGRHNPVIRAVDPTAPLSVGNGGFAFTVDVTGLQSFGDLYYAEGIPLETLARWAWHSEPNPKGYVLADANAVFDTPQGPLVLPTNAGSPAGEWLRRNPHGVPLARIGLELVDGRARAPRPDDLRSIEQTLDLWSGVIRSSYELAGTKVVVETACHPERDAIAVRIVSALVKDGRLRVRISFPKGHRLDVKNTPPLDWTEPERHKTNIIDRQRARLDLERVIDDTRFHVAVSGSKGAHVAHDRTHELVLSNQGREQLGLTVAFSSQRLPLRLASVDETLAATRAHWPRFWQRVARSISRAAPTRGRSSWSAASSSPNTSPPSRARDGFPRRSPVSRATPGTGNTTPR